MEIVDNRALKLRVRKPDRITQVIPKSKVIGASDGVYDVLVHWDIEEAHVLRNLGVKNIPSPILGKYKWPGLYKPFDHQMQTAAFLTMHRRAYCLNEMGTGKSCSVLWAADYLMARGLVRRALIVCPLSIMDSAWRADAFKSVMHRTVDIAYGAKDKRKKVIASDAEIVIINYDGIEVVCDEIARGGFDLIIIDELTHYKNAQSQRWKVMNSLIKHDTWLWGMTGSPAAQSPTDAYGLAKLMNPASVPKFFGAFRDSVMVKITQFKYIPKPGAEDVVYKVLQPAIRYTKEECLDLPEMLYTTRVVPLTAQQAKYYKRLKEQMVIEAAGEEITTVNAAVNLNKLLQIACIEYNTPVLTDSGWKPIQTITASDFIWDGVDWVNSQGAIFRGIKPVEKCFGVGMTLDHKVLTTQGWVIAEDILNGKSCNKFSRASVRLPNSNSKKWYLSLRDKIRDAIQEVKMRMACGSSAYASPRQNKKTYDLINCGPRNRFVVLGTEGPLIVHNCGSIYADNKEVIEFDASNRLTALEEVIDESSHKVLVFANFRHGIEMIQNHLIKKGYTTDVIHGGIPAGARTTIFQKFQTEVNPRVLVIQPQSASHGVTLTAANTIVWFGPVTSYETYVQANARVHRAGQKNACMVIHLTGCPVEDKLYRALEQREKMQNSILSLYEEEMNS